MVPETLYIHAVAIDIFDALVKFCQAQPQLQLS